MSFESKPSDSPSTAFLTIASISDRRLAALLRDYPRSRFFTVGNNVREGLTTLDATTLLSTRFGDLVAVDALQPPRELERVRIALCLARAKCRWVYDSGDFVRWTRAKELRARLDSLRVFSRPLSGDGFGNDFDKLRPREPVNVDAMPSLSVIVPVYNRKEYLAKTLAGLSLQTYPKSKFEVIVADDGSSDRPEELDAVFADALNLRWVRQEDRGYRLAAVRNLAIRAAKNDIVVSLDCDMIPARDLIRTYGSWFARHSKSLIVAGDRRYVDASSLDHAELIHDPSLLERLPSGPAPNAVRGWIPGLDWRHTGVRLSRGLRSHRHPYRFANGGNVAYRRDDALQIGGYDEQFQHWGGEDADFAHRLVNFCGAYVAFDKDAVAFHQHHPETTPRASDRSITRSQIGARVSYYRHWCDEAIVRPQVSVYMPAKNVDTYIGRAIQSVLGQRFEDLELCIVDDGSSDGTASVVEEFAQKDSRVRWRRREATGGIATASQLALEMCRGEFIVQLDADDELTLDAVGTLVRALRRDPNVSLVYGGFARTGPTGVVESLNYGRKWLWREAVLGNVATHPRAFRLRDYHRTTGFDPALSSAVDFDVYLKLASVGRTRHLAQILYLYRQHAESTSASKRNSQIENHRAVSRRAIASHFDGFRLGIGSSQNPTDDVLLDSNGRAVQWSVSDSLSRFGARVRKNLRRFSKPPRLARLDSAQN